MSVQTLKRNSTKILALFVTVSHVTIFSFTAEYSLSLMPFIGDYPICYSKTFKAVKVLLLAPQPNVVN